LTRGSAGTTGGTFFCLGAAPRKMRFSTSQSHLDCNGRYAFDKKGEVARLIGV
jgi:hypothetical protein